MAGLMVVVKAVAKAAYLAVGSVEEMAVWMADWKDMKKAAKRAGTLVEHLVAMRAAK
jgi:hypothetical protein